VAANRYRNVWRSLPPRHVERYVPALDHDWLTPFYDPLVRLTMPERRIRRQLIDQMHIRPDFRVLDLGCGTGTLAVRIMEASPGVKVFGIDGDERILQIAARKIRTRSALVLLQQGMIFALPYSDGAFDRIVSKLVLHHLTFEQKRQTLLECRRVLRSGGELHIADWGRPHNWLMWLASWPIRILDGAGLTKDNLGGQIPTLCRESGFVDVVPTARFMTLFGTLELQSATRP
jgi:SAM-dependent methyltransferase